MYRNSVLVDKLLEKEVLKTTLQGIELKINSLLQGANTQSCPQVRTADDEIATIISSLTDYDETCFLQPLYRQETQPQFSSFEEFSEGFSRNIETGFSGHAVESGEAGFSGVCFETDINKLDISMPLPPQLDISMQLQLWPFHHQSLKVSLRSRR